MSSTKGRKWGSYLGEQRMISIREGLYQIKFLRASDGLGSVANA